MALEIGTGGHTGFMSCSHFLSFTYVTDAPLSSNQLFGSTLCLVLSALLFWDMIHSVSYLFGSRAACALCFASRS